MKQQSADEPVSHAPLVRVTSLAISMLVGLGCSLANIVPTKEPLWQYGMTGVYHTIETHTYGWPLPAVRTSRHHAEAIFEPSRQTNSVESRWTVILCIADVVLVVALMMLASDITTSWSTTHFCRSGRPQGIAKQGQNGGMRQVWARSTRTKEPSESARAKALFILKCTL